MWAERKLNVASGAFTRIAKCGNAITLGSPLLTELTRVLSVLWQNSLRTNMFCTLPWSNPDSGSQRWQRLEVNILPKSHSLPDINLTIRKIYLYVVICVSIQWLWYHCGTQRLHQEQSKLKCSFRSFYPNSAIWICDYLGVTTIKRLD